MSFDAPPVPVAGVSRRLLADSSDESSGFAEENVEALTRGFDFLGLVEANLSQATLCA